MQSENFDQRIKDALDQTPPGNENPDWERMEKMLDKHLPQKKKDRRRFFLILFMFLLAGGAGYFVWENGRGNKNEIVSAEQKSTVTDQDKINNESIATKTAPESTTEVSSNTEAITPVQPAKKKSNEPINKSSVVVEKDQDSFNQNIPEKETVQPNEIVIKRNKQKKNPTPAITTNNKKVIEKTTADPVKESFAEKKHEIVAIPQKENDHVISPEKNESTIKETENPVQQEEKKITEQTPETKESQPTATAETGNKKQRSKGSFLNNLFFTASAGPDVSSVGMDKTGKIRLATGVGIGYQVSNKFSIRTGFYSASKVYSADPEDYKPPYNVAQYYPNLKNIDANCKVYEIPVMVDYTISNNKKRSWFVSAGVSSLIMKKETYEYYFKPNYSPTYITYSRTINNENKHYFSQLNFSGGYRMNLNKNFSLQAEPYMKIAMNGVGFGKVNLNSAGILFSAVIKPFAKK